MGIERHHYVPQGFLKGFTSVDENSDKFIWVYEKEDNRRPRRVSIKSVAWESYYYDQETESGARDTDTFEKALASSIDNFAPAIIRSIEATPGRTVNLSEEDRGIVAFFLGLSLTRVPSFREPIRQYYTKMAQWMLDESARTDSEIARGLNKYGVWADAKSWVSLQPMVQVAKVIGQSALQKKWQFFVPPEGFSLITSDNPVVFDVSREYGTIPAGPAHPLAELVMNLRKDLALVCTPRQGGEQLCVFQMGKEERKKFNRGMARAARRFVFSDIRSEGVGRLVKKYCGSQQTIIIEGAS